MLDALSAGARDRSNVAVVGVDADNIGGYAVGFETGDDDVSGTAVLGAVAAGSEELADADDGVVFDCRYGGLVFCDGLWRVWRKGMLKCLAAAETLKILESIAG